MLSDIFLPFPQGMERKLKPRSAKALVLPNLNIKATSLKVPAFTDLYDGTKYGIFRREWLLSDEG